MKLLRRAPLDPAVIAAQAAAQQAAAHAAIEQARLQAQLDRELREAATEEARIKAAADEQERRRRDEARRTERAAARDRRRKGREEFLAKARPVLPLLLINGGAAYAQAAYAFEHIAPGEWTWPAKLAFAVAFAAALESIAVYVQWHAHDALMLRAHATAASLRRASWVIAGVVGVINYAHFADGMQPTAAAAAFALLSLLSPWLWGLHTRRAQHVQLLAEDANLIDEGGVEFSPQRRRAFPIRSWLAKRWSIDHYERDPRQAWEGYNAERATRKAERDARRAEQATAKTESDEPAEVEPPVDPWDYAVPIGPVPDLVTPPPTEPDVKPAVSRPRPRSLTTADKVARAAAKMPGATPAQIAAKAGVSESTARRYMPPLPPAAAVAQRFEVPEATVTDQYARMGYGADGRDLTSASGPAPAETAPTKRVNGHPVELVEVAR